MGVIYNQQRQTEKRKFLRKNMTKAEAMLWNEIKARKILGYKFRRQFSVDCFVVDFLCPKLKLAIEVDGLTHITDEEIEYDNLRQSEIELTGIEFMRFTNLEIYYDLFNVVDKIKRKVEELDLKVKTPSVSPPL